MSFLARIFLKQPAPKQEEGEEKYSEANIFPARNSTSSDIESLPLLGLNSKLSDVSPHIFESGMMRPRVSFQADLKRGPWVGWLVGGGWGGTTLRGDWIAAVSGTASHFFPLPRS